MRFIVTGGAGFIGSNIARELKRLEHEVIVVDDFSSGDFRNLIGFRGEICSIDIANYDELPELFDIPNVDGIFHQAAITDTTVMDQKRMMRVNNDAFREILYWADDQGIDVVYASSAGVYGNSPAPNRIDQGLVPENIYGFSKYAMDCTASTFLDEAPDMRIIGLRYFNVYGPGESHKGHAASMVYQLFHQILAGKQPRLFKYGEHKRDFVYIRDVVQANLNAMLHRNCESGIYNVGTGAARTFNDMIAILQRELGTNLEIEYFDNPYSFYQNHTQADIGMTTRALGYQPEFSFEQGIAEYVAWLREQSA